MKKLERRLDLRSVIAISISSMLGSGLFVLPGLAFELTGPSLWLAYATSALCVLPAALSKCELATAMPTSGGTYVYLERTFGPIMGTVAGLGLWVSLLFKAAFALVGLGAYLAVLADVDLITTALSLLGVILLSNILGVGKVSSLLTFVITITILSVIGIESIGFAVLEKATQVKFFEGGLNGFLMATSMVFVSFAGVTKVAAIAEEVKNPEKNLPKGILSSLFIVSMLYCSMSFTLSYLLPMGTIKGSLKPLYILASNSGGEALGIAISVVAILTMTSMANAGILAASRFPFAMGRDGLMPSAVGRLNHRFLTPILSILLSGTIVAAAILTLNVAKIAKYASAFMLMIYVCENIAVVFLRESRVQWYTPSYRVKLYPWVQVFGILTGIALLVSMGAMALTAISSITIAGLALFFIYSRPRTSRKGLVGVRGVRKDLVEDGSIVLTNKLESIELETEASVVVSLFGRERSSDMLVEMAVALSDHKPVEVVHFTEIPEQTDYGDLIEVPMGLKSLTRRIRAMADETGVPITFDAVVTHDMLKSVYEISQRLHCRWLLVEWGGRHRGTFTLNNPIGWLRDHLHCNFGIFRDAGIRYIRKILVLLKDDKNDNLVLDTAYHLAVVHKARLTLCRCLPPDTDENKIHVEKNTLRELAGLYHTNCDVLILQSNDEAAKVVEISTDFDLVIFGVSEYKKTGIKGRVFGTEEDHITQKVHCSVLKVQTINDDNMN